MLDLDSSQKESFPLFALRSNRVTMRNIEVFSLPWRLGRAN